MIFWPNSTSGSKYMFHFLTPSCCESACVFFRRAMSSWLKGMIKSPLASDRYTISKSICFLLLVHGAKLVDKKPILGERREGEAEGWCGGAEDSEQQAAAGHWAGGVIIIITPKKFLSNIVKEETFSGDHFDIFNISSKDKRFKAYLINFQVTEEKHLLTSIVRNTQGDSSIIDDQW